MLWLLWAAGVPDPGARYPAAIAGPSPPADVALPCDPASAPGLHRLLAGVSPRLLDELLVQAQRRPAFMSPGLRRDHVSASAFFAHGPRALRELRLRHGRRTTPISREDVVSLLAAEIRAAIGEVELPVLPDPTGGLLGRRAGRAQAVRAARPGPAR